ncbi:unnamed protein product [Candidula unifasciata]|uniref:Small ribosomal subunit protein uS10 domain-containing protein n=1 Tax=Candidula unifasciata TaxID=100452 RepID=A0A8S3ZT88_9EUPU|nr:unnamed protein product [Candidula unifasciata]
MIPPSLKKSGFSKDGSLKTAAEKAPIHRICITQTSRIVTTAEEKNLKVKVPVHTPTKIVHISTPKTLRGEGFKTWDRLQLRIHNRIIDRHIEPDVHVEVTITGAA